MVGYREREIGPKEIDQALNSPRARRTRQELTNMAEALKRTEEPDGVDANDDDMQRGSVRTEERMKPLGPLANRDNEKRVARSAENVERIMRDLRRRPPGAELQQHEDEDNTENEEEEDFDPDFVDSAPEKAPQTPQQQRNRRIITNRQSNGGESQASQGRQPVPLSEVQKLRLEIAEQNKKIEELASGKKIATEHPGPPKLRFSKRTQALADGAVKLDLLSNFLFYDFSPDDFTVRPVDMGTQIGISAAKAARDGDGDSSALIDHLQSLMNPNVDIRLLTYQDYYFLVCWLRINSYPKIPFDVKWTSKYGNRNSCIIDDRKFFYMRAEPDPDKLEYWKGLGLDFPRLRDWEILNNFELAPDDRAVYERAQYFAGNTPQEKVDRMFASPVSYLEEALEMEEACRHGVVDSIDVVDADFDPVMYLKQLDATIAQIYLDAEPQKEVDPMLYTAIRGRAAAFEVERDEISEKITNKERVEPDAERITLAFAPLDIFPVL